MLEPLIVLTVLNCFFMFSSTVTTCALWWQYRSHRCCFKREPMTAKQALSKLKSSQASKTSRKSGNAKQDSHVNGIDRDGSNPTVHRDSKNSKRSVKQKSRSNTKYLLQNGIPSGEELSSIDATANWELEERTRMSEASQTANDARSAVVMEYSTVQKIVQILDNDVDLTATRMAIKDNYAKQTNDEKKIEQNVEPKLETEAAIAYEPMAEQ